jgi:membrane-bound lytic murein transglycosylase B
MAAGLAPDNASAAARAKARTAPAEDLTRRDDVRAFIDDMVARHGFTRKELTRTLADARYSHHALKLVTPVRPPGQRVWNVYRARFLQDTRVIDGAKFWHEHADTLARASDRYGVPPEIIVAIIGVETLYGRTPGSFRALDVLLTLGMDDTRRAPFFRQQLEELLLFARESRVDVRSVLGSYAGAIGIPQFMPGSIRKYAVDFDGDGRIDLRGNPVDAIGSVASFLSMHGWVPGRPTHYSVKLAPEADLAPLIAFGIEPLLTSEDLAYYGVGSDDNIDAEETAALIDLPNGDSPTMYVLGARNFYVITRYNRSSFYAMSVIELAQAIKRARTPQTVMSDAPSATARTR